MADETPKPSLKDFLKERAPKVAPAPAVPKAPTPQSEKAELPTKMTPAPKAPQRPGLFRQAAAAYTAQALKGTGALGQAATQRIAGGSRSGSGMARAPGYSGTAERVRLSKANKAPDGTSLRGVNDIDQAIVMLDKTQREFSVYVQNEFKSIRDDLDKVSTVASNAAKAVEQLKKDAKANAFKNAVAKGSIRGKNGRFMTADQAEADPDSVADDPNARNHSPNGAFDAIWGFVKNNAGTVATGAAGLYGAKKASGIAKALAGRTAANAAKAAAPVAGATVTSKAAGSFAGRVGKSMLRGKGSMYGLGIDALQGMKNDSETGNHTRTWLRGIFGIEDDPNELAPWQKNADGTPKQKDAVRTAPKTDDTKIDSPDSIEIESKKSISLTAMTDIKFEARNEFTIKARSLIIDAEKIEFKGNAKFSQGASEATGPKLAASGGQSMRGGENLSLDDLRYQDNVNKYGREKADELQKAQAGNSWGLGNVLNKVNPFATSKIQPTGGGSSLPGSMYNGAKGTQARPPDAAGKYRPVYNLGENDTHDDVVNTVAGEAYTNNQQSVDAVIHNMMNRVGTKGYGPSGNLREVARAPGQYAGYRAASPKEAEFIRSRMKEIASGNVEDPTGGANEYRAGYYNGPWAQKHADAPVIGGNRFAYNPDTKPGPYAPYSGAGGAQEKPKGPESTMYNGSSAIVNMGKGLQGMGLRVSENSAFGGVEDGVHKGRGHSDDRAIDVNVGQGVNEASHPQWGGIYDKLAEHVRGQGYKVIWRSAGHDNHMHIEAPDGMKPNAIDMSAFYKKLSPEERSFIEKDRNVKLEMERKADVATADAVAANPVPKPQLGPTQDQKGRPGNIQGSINLPAVGDFKATSYRAGSGGFTDQNGSRDTAIPYGTYPIGSPQAAGPTVANYSGTNAPVMPVGFGDGNRVIPDPKLGRNRTDIQIHSDNDASKLLSLGCLAIPKSDYPKFLEHMKAKIAKEGPQVLRISPSPQGQSHKFEILSAEQAAQAPASAKMPVADAAKNFVEKGDVNPAQSMPAASPVDRARETLRDKFDEVNMAKKDAEWLARGGPSAADAKPVSSSGSGMPPVQATDGIKSITVNENGKKMSMSDQLGARDIDAQASDAEMVRGIPTPPNLHTNDDPDAGQRLTDSIKDDDEATTKDEKGSTIADKSEPSMSARTGKSTNDIQAPVNHPESEAPRPGSDGYGDQQHDPDDCGLCAT